MLVVDLLRQYQVVLLGVASDAVAPTREVVRAYRRQWGKAELGFVAEPGVTELSANGWKHTAADRQLLLRAMPDDLRPESKEAGQDEENGQGLFLPAAMAAELHDERLLRGKRMSFGLLTPAAGDEVVAAPGRGTPAQRVAGLPGMVAAARGSADLTPPSAGEV